MSEIVASITRPEVLVIKNIKTQPCNKKDQPVNQQFLLDHRMIVTVAIRDNEESPARNLVELNCMCVNMDSRQDQISCMDTDFKEVIQRVNELDVPLNNLIIVHSANICKKATLEELGKAFEKIQCVLCRASSLTFKIEGAPGIYFDYKFMQPKSAKWISASLREYDGDMRKEVYADGEYIHKINLH